MRLHLLDLFDTVLQDGYHGVLTTQAGQPFARGAGLSGFDREYQHIDRSGQLLRVGVYRTGHHDRRCPVGPQLDAVASRVAAQQHRVPRGMQQRGDRRADGAGAYECDLGAMQPKVPGWVGQWPGPLD
ncbi:hypothetical protein I551_9112 [Mycobacterium ulcerans str. Harvey]|uniref:Uncharacterized protein n=1 Tax=Mycobacterium ulcerans str. Harvey TaxID=1299332 RepID=A0ABP3ATB7_MYCUL|nr:hypothetical protein I551_9112 [Mycobacterium ulcerans str. Harvey]